MRREEARDLGRAAETRFGDVNARNEGLGLYGHEAGGGLSVANAECGMCKGGFSMPSPAPNIDHPPIFLRISRVLFPFGVESWLARVRIGDIHDEN